MTGIGMIISMTIIIAIVLLFSILIYTKTSIFNKNINSCETKGGNCVKNCGYNVANFKCDGQDLVCCIGLGS